MPISVKKDLKRAYSLGNNFFLGSIPSSTEKNAVSIKQKHSTFLKFVKPVIADQNWADFFKESGLEAFGNDIILSGITLGSTILGGVNYVSISELAVVIGYTVEEGLQLERNIAKCVARKFNLEQNEEAIFDELWPIVSHARSYNSKKKTKEDIDDDLIRGYTFLAKIAAEQAPQSEFNQKPTFKRHISREDRKVVIFSDFHMTAYNSGTKKDYFDLYNHRLYLDVLKSYYANSSFCLVENGDVEECVISQYTLQEAKDLNKALRSTDDFPIDLDNSKWTNFLTLRYAKRQRNLDAIIEKYSDYYTMIRDKFISTGRYVRLTGNHDTYRDDDEFEVPLLQTIEDTLNKNIASNRKVEVNDVLILKRGHKTKYIILHGHQFDTVSMQHGEVSYAKSIGETISECLAWCNEGADRIWEKDDTQKWLYGNPKVMNVQTGIETKGNFHNQLAREEHSKYRGNEGNMAAIIDLVLNRKDRIKGDSKSFVEATMGHEIAWEYFENSNNGFEANTLEQWTGDEGYKLRHLNEIDLCEKYKSKYQDFMDDNSAIPPKIIIGHTHEVRQNSVMPPTFGSTPLTPFVHKDWYLNSGSAGRFDNLIWCVEIIDNIEIVVSWSNVNGKLRRIPWKSDGGLLVHDEVNIRDYDVLS